METPNMLSTQSLPKAPIVIKKNCTYKRIYMNNHVVKLLNDNDIVGAKDYLKKFFFKYGKYCFYYDGTKKSYDLLKMKDIGDLISKDTVKMNPALKKAKEFSAMDYLHSSEFSSIQYIPTIRFDKPNVYVEVETMQINENEIEEYHIGYINMKKPINIISTIETVDRKEIQSDLDLIEYHIKKVLCSNQPEQYEFFLNFIACTFGGRKVRKALLLQSTERTGKGLVMVFLNKILGEAMLKTSSLETVTMYTKPMEGTLLVNIDEMPAKKLEFQSVSDIMKALITEPTFTSRSMYSNPYPQDNTFNIILTTNNDSIVMTQTNKTKYVCVDIDESYVGKHEYFEKVAKSLKKKEVQLAFYNDMMKRFKDLDDWNEDIAMPETRTLRTKIIEALPQVVKHLKEEYVLKNKGINEITNVFFKDYKELTKDNTTKQKLNKYLGQLGIEAKKCSDNNYRFIISAKDLHDNFKNLKWMDDTVDLVEGLPPFINYLKEEYVLKKKGINMVANNFINEYFSQTKDSDTSKMDIENYLKELGIEPKKKTDGKLEYSKYVVKADYLLKQFRERDWIDDADKFEDE